jgi:L-ascorbate metabolism protein UlaG (beta-lactamase superfamily)
VPARHYSGRELARNNTLWTGFVLESGKRFGNFDLVALDMGQYDPRWPSIHMSLEEAAQAAQELNAKALLPAHVGRFSMAHACLGRAVRTHQFGE